MSSGLVLEENSFDYLYSFDMATKGLCFSTCVLDFFVGINIDFIYSKVYN